MAASEGVRKLKEHYFFGFAKFFNFSDGRKHLGHIHEQQTNAKEQERISYKTPIRINCATNFDKACVTWSTIFYLSKNTGKVHVYGWCNGRKITGNENVFLLVDCKISCLNAQWNKFVLISDDGKCHVTTNLHNDWTPSVYENKIKFTTCDVGDMHAILLDENGQAYQLENQNLNTDNDIKCSNFPCVLSQLQLKEKVDLVSCGKEHVLLLDMTFGHVFSFGLGSRGQLGHGTVDAETTPKIIEALAGIPIKHIAAGGWHSLALSNIGDIYAWGWNNHGQLGIKCLPPEVPQAFYMLPYIVDFPQDCVVNHIACGARHSVAVTSEGVWSWGWGQYGQLGHGNDLDRTVPTLVEYFQEIHTPILDVSCGPWQTIVTLEANL